MGGGGECQIIVEYRQGGRGDGSALTMEPEGETVEQATKTRPNVHSQFVGHNGGIWKPRLHVKRGRWDSSSP